MESTGTVRRARGRIRRLRLPALLPILVLSAAAAAQEGAPAEAPAKGGSAAPASKGKEGPPAEVAWAKDLDAARAAAAERGRRILAVVLQDLYPSEPCRAVEKALEDRRVRELLAGFVPLKVVEKEDPAFSRERGLEALGHPYAALLDAEGRVIASLRGAWPAEAWVARIRRLAAAADRWEEARKGADAAPGDPKALWALSEALRALGRVGEADDVLARAENADREAASGLRPLFRFRRMEARVEDRIAVQDFEGARALLDAYDHDFPASPRRRWVAYYRAITRAYTGDLDGALEDLEAVATATKDEDLAERARERAEAVREIREKRK